MKKNWSPPSAREWEDFVRSLQSEWKKYEDQGPEEIRRLIKADRYYLLVKILNRKEALHPWIYERCREVEENPDGYIDIWAREHWKSSLVTNAGIIQEILKDQEITVAILSHTKPIAKAFLAQIKREFEANEKLRTLFPEIFWDDPQRQSPSWSLDNGIIVKREGNPKEATVEAHGLVDGQPTSRHFKLLVYDDVVVPESVTTPEQIKKTTEAWELSDNLGSAGGRKWMLGTRYHHSDTYSEIVKRKAAKERIYPATDDGTLEGVPVLFSQEYWESKKTSQGDSTVSCQLLCNPLAGKQKMFNVEDLRVYEIRPFTLMAYLLIDPARSNKKDSANTAMIVIGIDANFNKYLLDGVAHKMELSDRWKCMRDLQEKWSRAPGIMGLKVGYENFGAQADMQHFQERMIIEKTSFEIIELNWPRDGERSKIDRVQRLTPDFKAHRFYVPYATDNDNLTRMQLKMIEAGQEFRVARPIRKINEDSEIYDVTENFKIEVSFFPFGHYKDIIDATSRIYDIEPIAPTYVDESCLEPEET